MTKPLYTKYKPGKQGTFPEWHRLKKWGHDYQFYQKLLSGKTLTTALIRSFALNPIRKQLPWNLAQEIEVTAASQYAALFGIDIHELSVWSGKRLGITRSDMFHKKHCKWLILPTTYKGGVTTGFTYDLQTDGYKWGTALSTVNESLAT